jgi:hypothetical protein
VYTGAEYPEYVANHFHQCPYEDGREPPRFVAEQLVGMCDCGEGEKDYAE